MFVFLAAVVLVFVVVLVTFVRLTTNKKETRTYHKSILSHMDANRVIIDDKFNACL